jgi:hypothetical protein
MGRVLNAHGEPYALVHNADRFSFFKEHELGYPYIEGGSEL